MNTTKRKTLLIHALARRIDAYARCVERGNLEWRDKHETAIRALIKTYMPSGSGFDQGTSVDLVMSTGEKVIFRTAYHHMDENGHYDGWTEHTVIARPSFVFLLDLRITGRDRNDTKVFIAEAFYDVLSQEIEQ